MGCKLTRWYSQGRRDRGVIYGKTRTRCQDLDQMADRRFVLGRAVPTGGVFPVNDRWGVDLPAIQDGHDHHHYRIETQPEPNHGAHNPPPLRRGGPARFCSMAR